jgi:hypothetical protein
MKTPSVPNTTAEGIADDMLCGADEIAQFLFGPNSSRRKVYYLAASTRIPVFRLGTKLCARRSVLLNWIAGQENRVQFRSSAPNSRPFSADRGDKGKVEYSRLEISLPSAPSEFSTNRR